MKYNMKQKVATATITAALMFSSIAAPAAWALQSAEVQSGVNFRSAPSTSASIIRSLKKGEEVTIIEKVNSFWYKIQDSNGKTGYLSTSSNYLKLQNKVESNNTAAVVKASVSFRKSPSTSGERIRYLKKGEQVSVLAKTNSYWYEVKDSDGVRGYVSTQDSYLDVKGTVTEGGSSSGGSSSNNGNDTSTTLPQESVKDSVEKVIAAGMKYIGTPYEYGSDRNTTTTFDCSDFVRQAFIDGAGLKLPADSRQQGDYVKKKGGTTTNWKNLKRGDVVFFMDYKGSKASAYTGVNKSKAAISHDGIYLGDGKILHTYSKESGGVTISSMEGTHWEYRFLYGGSAL